MWRAVFLALGIGLFILGIEALVLDHAVLAADSSLGETIAAKTEPVYDEYGFEIDRKVVAPSKRIVKPPEWAPWSMLSSGSIVLVYALASRYRKKPSGEEG